MLETAKFEGEAAMRNLLFISTTKKRKFSKRMQAFDAPLKKNENVS